MNYKPEPKRDRRRRADRRACTRGGRRSMDGAKRCPECGSADVELVGIKDGLCEYRCQTCRESWVSYSRTPPA
jgi:transcription elongation factor Elf1